MKDSTYDTIFELDNNNGFGDEFDWFDEFPEDDPFIPKPACTRCHGLGELEGPDGRDYNCPDCDGTGIAS